MWIAKDEYRALVDGKARAEAIVQWLTVRLNQLEHDVGQQKADATGRSQLVPRVEHAHTVKPGDREVDFEDVGDVDARRLGIPDSDGFAVGVI